VNNYIIAARTSQGYDEYRATPEEKRRDIVNRWAYMQKDLKKKKTPVISQLETMQAKAKDARSKRKMMKDDLIARLQQSRSPKSGSSTNLDTVSDNASTVSDQPHLSHRNTYPDIPPPHLGSGRHTSSPSTAINPPPYNLDQPPNLGAPSQAGAASSEGQLHPLGHVTSAPTIFGSAIRQTPAQGAPQQSSAVEQAQDDEDLLAAIRESLSHPTDSTEEQRNLERAMAVSAAELQRARAEGDGGAEDEEEAMQRAMRASVVEMNLSEGATEEERRELEEVLRQSKEEHARRSQWTSTTQAEVSASKPTTTTTAGQNVDEDSDEWWSDDDEDPEEELKRAMELSLKSADEVQRANIAENLAQSLVPVDEAQVPGSTSAAPEVTPAAPHPPTSATAAAAGTSTTTQAEPSEEEEELKRAIEQSQREHAEREREKTEEEIVMEYVKKQSLLESEHRKNWKGKDNGNEDSGEGSSASAAKDAL
jgi:hypothetical protein